MLSFNVNGGVLEAMIHGYRNGFLRPDEYNNLVQCDSLGDLKTQLQVTDYGNFLQNEPTLTSRTIADRAIDKLVTEFNEVREWSVQPMAQFLDFITYDYMISNVLKLISAARNSRESLDMLYKCHPLGMFTGISALRGEKSVTKMFNTVLVDSPIGRFFQNSSEKDFDELSLEYIRGLLQKNYLEAFFEFCEAVGGETATVMCPILAFEADRAVITITANTCGVKDITPDDRKRLYPNIGTLEALQDDIKYAEDEEQLKEKLKRFPEFYSMFDDGRGMDGHKKSIEKKFVEKSVELYKDAMMRQFQFGVFYGWVKLKELEVHNLIWIAECITQNMKSRIHEFTPT
jgi:V-type H+-transporting ATPase subunit d